MLDVVEHYDDGEQTVQVPCDDGKVVSFHVEETTHLRLTIYPDSDRDHAVIVVVHISSELAIQMIRALSRPDFLRALGGW